VKKDCDLAYDEKKIQDTIANPGYLLARTLSLLLSSRIEENGGPYREKALALADAIIKDGRGETRRENHIRLQVLAIIYDWLGDSLPAAEKERLRAQVISFYQKERGVLKQEDQYVSGYSHFTTASVIVAALALADGSGEYEKELDLALRHWEKHLEVARYVAADGGHHLGWRYGRSYASRLVWVSEAITTATGRDVFQKEKAWLSQLGYHVLYGLRPDETYFRVGDSHRYIHMNLDEDLLLSAILASRYGDPHMSWLASKALDTCLEHGSMAYNAQFVFALLFFEPDPKAKSPVDLPLVRAFPRAGNYTLRSGWGPDDTVVLFRAMPWYHFNHERRDFGSFLIYHHGGLAVHGGTYQAGDKESDYNGSHLENYAWRTAAHNTITVFDPDEKFCRPIGPGNERCEGENRWSNDGGQKIRSRFNDDVPVPWYEPRNVSEIQDPCFQQGSVPLYEDRPELTYILADGAKAYRKDKVKLFERHFFFLKSVVGWKHPVIVIFDRVVSASPSFKKTWNLHTVEVPERNENVFTLENKARVRFGGDLTAKPNDYWCEYSGKLYCETLLPKNARLEFVGGEGKEFWVNGKNYPTRIREVDRITEPGIGRIEVSPSTPSLEDLFLHVLWPADPSDKAPRLASLIESQKDVGLRAGNYLLLFPRDNGERSSLSYRVDSDQPLLHVVTRVSPSKAFRVILNGSPAGSEKSSPNGVLLFRTERGGSVQVLEQAK
jgi:heparin/heparan-sulfate lyase